MSSMSTVLPVLFNVCLFAAVLFIVRLLCAPFSSKVSRQMRRHPVAHVVWACFAVVGALMFLAVLNPTAWPLPSLERREQRKKVLERVHSVGGWEAVRQGCQALTTNYPDGLEWFPPRSNAWVYPNPQTEPRRYYVTNLDYGPLPAAVAALKPKEIRYLPPRLLVDIKDAPQVAIVRIKIFGMHSSGGHSTPYYGLEVSCGAGAERYEPSSHDGVPGNRHGNSRKVADGIFEIY